MLQIRARGIILRSRAKWAEEGEKNTKYFLNLEKPNYNSTYIRKLIGSDGKEIVDLNEIISEQKQFYQDLYTSKLNEKVDENLINEFTDNNNIPKLTESDKATCEIGLSVEECSAALKNFANNKSPGNDSLTTNVFGLT